MKNKEIQEQRMKQYFLQATKEILKAEGIKGVSARNIAAQAGYSYATIYNYFRDINDLIFFSVQDFQEECLQFVREKTTDAEDGISKLVACIKAYIDYFVEYPGIFDLFYLTPVNDFGGKAQTISLIGQSLDQVCEDSWQFCKKNKLIKKKKMEATRNQVRYTIIGLLLMYNNRRIPADYSEFLQEVSSQLDHILPSK